MYPHNKKDYRFLESLSTSLKNLAIVLILLGHIGGFALCVYVCIHRQLFHPYLGFQWLVLLVGLFMFYLIEFIAHFVSQLLYAYSTLIINSLALSSVLPHPYDD